MEYSSSDMQQVPRSEQMQRVNAGVATPRPSPYGSGERSFGELPLATRHASAPLQTGLERPDTVRMQSMPTRRTFSLRRSGSRRSRFFGCFMRMGGKWLPRLLGSKGKHFYPEFGAETRRSGDRSCGRGGSGGPPSSVEDLSEDFLFEPTDQPISMK